MSHGKVNFDPPIILILGKYSTVDKILNMISSQDDEVRVIKIHIVFSS